MKGRIEQGGAAAYDSPVPGRDNVLFRLAPGTEVEVLVSEGDFYFVKMAGRSEPAYIHRLEVDIVPEPPDSPKEAHPGSATSARGRDRKAETSGAGPGDELAYGYAPMGGSRMVTWAQLWRFLMACVAAVVFFIAGRDMRGIESVSGDSIAEVFYHAVGLFSWGMAVLSLAFAVTSAVPASVKHPGLSTHDDLPVERPGVHIPRHEV